MERRAATVRGIVQGVGFRPYVYWLASQCELAGFVQNAAGVVRIEVEGKRSAVDRFFDLLAAQPPPLAKIEAIVTEPLPCRGERDFHIDASVADDGFPVVISPDLGICAACLAEMQDASNRRFLYPFTNCAHCGPRLTIVRGAPYDRVRTAMAGFAMCAECQQEYDDPANRRFHAQATCCPRCGPTLQLLDRDATPIPTANAVEQFARFILQGQIGALKGLGGYHLVCDATSAGTVEKLRQRKFRDAKPFAVIVDSLENARKHCEVSAEEARLLTSPCNPIVLLRRRTDAEASIAEAVAPGNPYLGVMLPYTPLHHLLMNATQDRPLVMTSGNRSDEPIAYRDEEATTRLRDIADSFLIHDRPIEVRCDDSVTRMVAGSEALVRRARGYAPGPLRLPLACPTPILAVGGQLKGAFALGENDVAIIGHHLGDLDHYEAYQAFVKDVALYEQLFRSEPGIIAHDLHPDYASTRYAEGRAQEGKVRCQAIQHHHAHVASCMAEHGLTGPVIGVAFDGTGYGTDGAIWGGEFLIADYTGFRRAAHLRYVPLPGGDQAIREPWRSTVAHLATAGLTSFIPDWDIASASVRTVRQMIEREVNSPRTSSAGRLFDAVAALLGLRTEVSYEGQAAMELEWLASGATADGYYPITIRHVETLDISEIDLASLFAAICRDLQRGTARSVIARRFHTTVVMLIVSSCEEIRQRSGLERVVLSGGCFLNALLIAETVEKLMERGFDVYRHQSVPTNDGGLCLGQLAIAAAIESEEEQVVRNGSVVRAHCVPSPGSGPK